MYKKYLVTFFVAVFLITPWLVSANNYVPLTCSLNSVCQNTGTTDLYLSVYFSGGTGVAYGNVFVSTSSVAYSFDTVTQCYASLSTVCSQFIVVPPLNYYIISGSNVIIYSSASAQYRESTSTTYIAIPTGTSTVGQIDNATQDYFYGVLLFFGLMWFIIWFFRKK